MKRGIFFLFMLTAVSAFSADAESTYQSLAESKYKYQSSISFLERAPERTETFNFDGGVDRVVVSGVDNPIRWLGFASEGVGSSLMAVQHIVREIHIYSGEQVKNCYIVFESEIAKREIKVKHLQECK